MDAYLGEIRIFGGNYAPQGWAFCNGQLLPISGNEALYSLLGTTYGGNGQNSFALPDLRGRLPLHLGQSTSGRHYLLGERGGTEQVTLSETQLPAHTHQAHGTATGSVGNPSNAYWGTASGGNAYAKATPNTAMAPQALSTMGNNQPHDNMMPSLGLSFIIAVQGLYPPRS